MYKLVNMVVKLNQVIIRNANLSFFINKFLEQFANCAISSFTDFFFDNN